MKPGIARTIITILLALLLPACGRAAAPTGKPAANGEGFVIATSFYPLYIIALNVAKDVPGVRVVNLTPQAAGCLHDYSATPDDMKKLESADCLIVNGAGLESFLGKVTAQRPGLAVIEAGKGIPLIKGSGDEGDNPHIWVSITNYIHMVRNVSDGLSALDGAHAESYKANAATYVNQLEDLKARMHQALDGLENRGIVTFHEAFPYFAEEFGLDVVGVVEREPGSAPSARELADTVKTIRNLKVKALFAEPQYQREAAETIARETSAVVYVLDPASTGPDDPEAYLAIMERNLGVLQEALR